MLFHRSAPKARFAGWAFFGLLLLFSSISLARPAAGLAGLGAVLVLGATLVEVNRDMIWQAYKKSYKKSKNPWSEYWNKPNELYNALNVYVIWPSVFLLGLAAIYAAYIVSK